MSKVSTKGQVTIPLAIRERLGLHPGTDVEFELADGSVQIRRVDGLTRGAAMVAHLRGRGATSWSSDMTTDEIMALTRGE